MDRTAAAPVDRPSLGYPPYHVMVVDDSAVIRGIIARALEADPEIVVVATASNGKIALDKLASLRVDVVVLDIEMPVMDGLTALPKLLAADPKIKVVMASTLTRENAETSLRALQAGAADYIPKPSSAREIQGAETFRRDLLAKVKALGKARRDIDAPPAYRAPATSGRPPAAAPAKASQPAPIKLRVGSSQRPQVLAIASSTGGPQALFDILAKLTGQIDVPVLITQHMPPTFTTILAEHIAKLTKRPCAEGVEGEPVVAGRIYVAPGDHHMLVAKLDGKPVIRLDRSPPVNFCRPAADPMLRSIAEVYRGHVLALVLTGMGQDGLAGCRAVVDAGGTVLAQDQATSVVWGMPGVVATAGLCSAVLPLPAIAGHISDSLNR